MLRAGAARLAQTATERFARAVESHGRIVRSDPNVGREATQRATLEIDRANRLAVFRLQRLKDARDTRADGVREVLVSRTLDVDLQRESFECPTCGSMPSTLIDDRVAQNSIKPGDDGLLAPEPATVLKRFRVGVLQEFLGQAWRADPLFNETKKPCPILEENLRRVR